jgi:K+-transporting ATPase KdpF subunit
MPPGATWAAARFRKLAGCTAGARAACNLKCRARRRRASPDTPVSPLRARGHGMGRAVQPAMTFEYVLGGVLSLALTAYLVYALLRPERF